MKLISALWAGITAGRWLVPRPAKAATLSRSAQSASLTGREAACLEIVSVNPARPHLVAAGGTTTFVVSATNTSGVPVAALLSALSLTEGWSTLVSEADHLFRSTGESGAELSFTLGAYERRRFVVLHSPDAGLPDGDAGLAEVSLAFDGVPCGTAQVQGKVRSTPKIYIALFDGLGREYVGLDRQGGYDNVDTDPLMPYTRAFLAESAWLRNARSQVPSATDPNHVAFLTGSWPGTSGAICVEYYYCGRNGNGQAVNKPASSEILRWGSTGEPVVSLFHAAKDPAQGGDSDALAAMILGKEWVGNYFDDIADVRAGGKSFPDYLPAPWTYDIGDPISDPDAPEDRDGWNLFPRDQFRMFPGFPSGFSGDHPDEVPEDRWVAEGALRILAAEDPDVLYVSPTLVDIAQHHTGAADRPDEWSDRGQPGVLWDDFDRFNPHGNREPVLDVVAEADRLFGVLVETLRARGVYEGSYVILAADHGQRTLMDCYLSATQICLDAGIPGEAFDSVFSGADVAYLWLSDPAYAEPVQAALEAFTTQHPVFGIEVNPLVAVTRDEMNTGVDGVIGRFAADGGEHNGELYSEWYIAYPVGDNSKPLWPDVIVFFEQRFQAEPSNPKRRMVGGHAGIGWPQQVPVIIRGPGVVGGTVSYQPAYLVDIAPTLCVLQGWTTPANADGRVLTEILTDRRG